MNKKLIIILIIVGVLAIGGGVWYWQNQREEAPLVVKLLTGLLPSNCGDKSFITKEADYIVEGVVEKVESRWNEEKTVIYTYTDLKVENYFKGALSTNKLQIVGGGGTVGEQAQWVEGQVILAEGNTVRLYFKKETNGKFYIVCGQSGIEPIEVKGILSPTADWKTYRNEEYGFEVKYPRNATAKEQDFSEPGSVRFTIDFGKISNNLPVKISVSNEDMIGVVKEAIVIIDEKEVIVNGIKGTQIIGRGQKEGSPLESIILLTKNQELYQIIGSGDIFDQTLSTFKFTK